MIVIVMILSHGKAASIESCSWNDFMWHELDDTTESVIKQKLEASNFEASKLRA